jgi:hypothetical protein
VLLIIPASNEEHKHDAQQCGNRNKEPFKKGELKKGELTPRNWVDDRNGACVDESIR